MKMQSIAKCRDLFEYNMYSMKPIHNIAYTSYNVFCIDIIGTFHLQQQSIISFYFNWKKN